MPMAQCLAYLRTSVNESYCYHHVDAKPYHPQLCAHVHIMCFLNLGLLRKHKVLQDMAIRDQTKMFLSKETL